MANAYLNAQTFANTMVMLTSAQLKYGKLVKTSFTDQVSDKNGVTTSVRRPPRFLKRTGPIYAAQDLLIGSATVTVDQFEGVDVSVDDLGYVGSHTELMRSSVMKSAATRLAQTIDNFLAAKTLEFSATAFTTPGTFGGVNTPTQFSNVHTELMDNYVPNSDINAVLTFGDAAAIRGSLVGGNIDGVNRDALNKTRIPVLSEIDAYASQNVPQFTTGTRPTAAGLINGAAQNVSYRTLAVRTTMSQSLILDTLGAGVTIKKGEVFTIANVFAWDQENQRAQAKLRRFTVLADATADGIGNATITISPAIIAQGTTDGTSTTGNSAYGTVSAAPADNALITFDGAASTVFNVRAAWHKSAIEMVSAKLTRPKTGEFAFQTDPETGISIRYWTASDILTGTHLHRFDTIFGATVVDRTLGARVYGV